MRLALSYLILLLFVGMLFHGTLGTTQIEDLDSAHTVMDAFYFHDLLSDRPTNPIGHLISYYRQYPALGFLFWPPLFPFVAGVLMSLGGIHIQTVHWCLMAFAFLLVCTAFICARRLCSWPLSLLAALSIVTIPIVGKEALTIMREMPALAMIFVAIAAYYAFVDRPTVARSFLWALASAAAVYTKQTAGFVYVVFAADILIHRRALLRKRHLWVGVFALALITAPLAVFTVVVSKVNVAQSFGSDRSFILGASSPNRWTLDSLLFYPAALIRLVNPIIVALGLLSLSRALLNREYRVRNFVWLAWAVCWLALFTLVLNKQDRHAILWLPAWCMLAAVFLADFGARKPVLGRYLEWILLIPVSLGAWQVAHYRPGLFQGVEQLAARVAPYAVNGSPANILYYGKYRQVLVPYVRLSDAARRKFVLNGANFSSDPIAQVCRDYQVRYLVAELGGGNVIEVARLDRESALRKTALFPLVTPWGAAVSAQLYEYDGPVASEMKKFGFNSRLVGASANQYLSR